VRERLIIGVVDGRPCSDRHWVECFAQLVGTILSLWDATALDAAGQDGEVAPTFINLADGAIKMVGSPSAKIFASSLIVRSGPTDFYPRSRSYRLEVQE
jgi:hypothetical protein